MSAVELWKLWMWNSLSKLNLDQTIYLNLCVFEYWGLGPYPSWKVLVF